MAIYHCSVKIIGRSSGRSSVAAAAYRAGEKIANERDGRIHDYTRKGGVVHSEIMLPSYAPKEYANRVTLWNVVEKVERRGDAQTAREVEVALPVEFDLQENIQVVREYINENFVSHGMCADFAIHDTDGNNPHAHILLSMRDVSSDGFQKKNREWNSTERLEGWRENWANVCNERLQQKGLSQRIDHRSLDEQGLEREPTIHVGRSKVRLAKNREIIKANERYKPQAVAEYMNELNEGYSIVKNHIAEKHEELYQHQSEVVKLGADIKDIHQRTTDIHKQYTNIQKAHAVRDSMGRLQSKREINTQIRQLEDTYRRSWDYYQQSFGVPPDEAQAKIEQLQQAYEVSYQKAYTLQRTDTQQYNNKMREFELEYKRQRLLAEIRPDSREIFQGLDRADMRLSKVTMDDFREVAKQLRSRQREMLRSMGYGRDRVGAYDERER